MASTGSRNRRSAWRPMAGEKTGPGDPTLGAGASELEPSSLEETPAGEEPAGARGGLYSGSRRSLGTAGWGWGAIGTAAPRGSSPGKERGLQGQRCVSRRSLPGSLVTKRGRGAAPLLQWDSRLSAISGAGPCHT